MTPGNTEAAVTIINGNWGLTSLSAIRAVLSSAHRVLVRSFEAAPEAAVHVSRWNRTIRLPCTKSAHTRFFSVRQIPTGASMCTSFHMNSVTS